ncbi:MAG: energy transducer TonB [Vitreoscilla sp.]|nr:energy transducer TonB [Burkholderiales bacterium]MBP6337435.1 energy transducer TonB [Vitreoscilla sp.]
MSTAVISFRQPVLAWSVSAEDEALFRKTLLRVVLACLLLALLGYFVPLPQPSREQAQALPAPMAKLLLERAVPPPPPPAPPSVKKTDGEKLDPNKPQEEKPAAEPKPAKAKPVPDDKRAPVPEARNPIAGKPPGELDAARRKASGIGLLAMKDQLAELHGAPAAVQLNSQIKPGPGVGASVGPGVGAGTEAGLPSRALITSNATNGSGGINTAAYSRDTGGGGLAGRSTTMVEGVAGGGGGGGPGGGGSSAKGGGTQAGTGTGGANKGGAVQRGNSGKAARSLEEIRLVFERNKGAIYAIYNRALREDPGLQGKVVLELKIAPAGQVTNCRLVSSELKAPELEQKLLARIRQFDFGAKEVDEMVVSWPLDFLPS